jgi:hypothetical protein
MEKRGRGCPQSTPSDRVRRLGLRNARRLHLEFEGAHLRAAAADIAAQGPRRSLRTTYLADNTSLLLHGQRPWYRLVLFGEPGYPSGIKGFTPPNPFRVSANFATTSKALHSDGLLWPISTTSYVPILGPTTRSSINIYLKTTTTYVPCLASTSSTQDRHSLLHSTTLRQFLQQPS